MPLLTLSELENATSLFRGRCGNALGRGLMRMLSVDKVNDLYDRYSFLKGPDSWPIVPVHLRYKVYSYI